MSIPRFFEACTKGDVKALRQFLSTSPALVRATAPKAPNPGWSALHELARRGHLKATQLLLRNGADPNAREAGDNTTPLHWAAAHRHIEIVRALLDAGADIHGEGDVHALDVIGWATFFRDPGRPLGDQPETAAFLIERGARHHVFSAMALGDLKLLRAVLKRDANAVHRHMSQFENLMSPLHFAIQINRHDMLKLLIQHGAPLEQKDKSGLTPLESAVLRGDRKATLLLTATGARAPRKPRASSPKALAKLAANVTSLSPMLYVPNVAATLNWYVSIGFQELERYEDNGLVNFGVVSFGKAVILINMNGKRGEQTASLWFHCDHIDDLYKHLKAHLIEFVEPINDTFYHARQFGFRDCNGYILYFIQQLPA